MAKILTGLCLDFLDNDPDLYEEAVAHPMRDLAQEMTEDDAFIEALIRKYASKSPTTACAENERAGPAGQTEGAHSLKSCPPVEGDWDTWEVPVNVCFQFSSVGSCSD